MNFSSYNKTIEILSLPIAMLAAALIVSAGENCSVLTWLVSMIPHELGHAFLSWLSGIFAIPTFGMTVHFSNEFSYYFSACFLGILGAGYYFASKANYRFWKYFCASTILCFFLFLFIPSNTKEMLSIWGGQAGELILSSIFIITFHYKMPKRYAWEKNRYLFLVMGCIVLLNATVTWHKATANLDALPMGALFDFGKAFAGESSGDLDRLTREFGWKGAEIASHYLTLSWLCILAVFAHYAWVWKKVGRKK